MALSPSNPYVAANFEETNQVTRERNLFPGSIEAVTIGDVTVASYVFSVAALSERELRPYIQVPITVTSGHFTVDSVITINGNYHRTGDVVEFSFNPVDVVSPRTITIKDSAATPNTLATISSTSEGTRSRSTRKFILGADGLWVSSSPIPTAGGTLPASPTEGDLLYYHTSAWASLAKGTANQVLVSNGTDPLYVSVIAPPSGIQPGAAGATLTKLLVGTKTWDPGSITAPNVQTTTVTVTGAAVGDYVVTTLTTLTAACVLTGYVSSSDTVTVVLGVFAGTVDVTSGTLNALVVKAA